MSNIAEISWQKTIDDQNVRSEMLWSIENEIVNRKRKMRHLGPAGEPEISNSILIDLTHATRALTD
jgi:hypothetical protein